MLSFEMGQAVAWLWLRGAWLGRIAMTVWIWPILLMLTLGGQEPHATGIRWLLIVLDLIACTVVAWVLASLPAYLIGRHRRRTVPNLTVRGSGDVAAAPGSLRLSR